MKKILLVIITACTLMAMPLHARSNKGTEVPQSKVLSDSVSTILGKLMGEGFLRDEGTSQTKELVFKGMQAAMCMGDNEDYLMGVAIGAHLLQSNMEGKDPFTLNTQNFLKSFEQAYRSDSIPEEERAALAEKMNELLGELKEIRLQEIANSPEAIAAKKNGEKFIDKMMLTKKYTRTASGLMYRVITPGQGECFGPEDLIKVIYTGKLVDGTVVEESGEFEVKTPAYVTPGCGEMLQLMKPGMKVEAIIPANLAYGLDGNPDRGIGPNETLIFEIETPEKLVIADDETIAQPAVEEE